MNQDPVGLDPIGTIEGGWTVSLDGPNQDRMRERLKDIDPSSRAQIFATASRILRQCPPPFAKAGRVTGLALGKVQSGKTSSFITLAAQAFDNGYRVAIILAGTKTNLLKQNKERIEEELSVGRDRDLIVNSTERGKSTLRPDDVAQLVKVGRPVVITVLKHHKHLKQVKAMFSHPDLRSVPVLVIDDEGDQASLNATPKKRRNVRSSGDGPNPKRTATNLAISELRKTLELHAYVSYTATPQAPLLIDTIDELSPDFCELIEPGADYTGGSVFHEPDQDRYVREVPADDEHSDDKMRESLESALAVFFVGAVIRHLKWPDDDHSMLVHTSHRQMDHGDVRVHVKDMVEEWTECLGLPDGDPLKTSVLTKLKKGHEDLAKTVGSIPSWDDVTRRIKGAIEDCKIWVVNSSDEAQIPDPKRKMPFKNNIFIGGNMLDRGVTIPGLAVTFITRRAKENQADTVEQRARWFGYKKRYLDLCRVWAPKPVLDGFSALLGHEDDFWAQLREIKEENRRVKDWKPRLLVLNDSSMKPTRSSVASYSIEAAVDWTTQLRAALGPAAAANMEIVRDFFGSLGAVDRDFSIQSHKVAADVNRQLIQNGLLNRLVQISPRWSGTALMEWFGKLSARLPVDVLDVIWVESDSRGIRTRTLKATGSIDGLLQGRSEAESYPGDRALLPNRAQLQVHTPIVKDSSTVHGQAVFLAIYIPGVEELGIRLIIGHDHE